MGNAPIGLGPNAANVNIGQSADAKATDALQFHAPDKGSTITELLRGKIGQLRMISEQNSATMDTPNFRELISPSALTLQVIGQLQGRS